MFFGDGLENGEQTPDQAFNEESTQLIVRGSVGKKEDKQPFRVLIADDEPDARILLRAILEQCDYEIYQAEDGEQALAMFWDIKPDIALLDLQMPGKTGLEVCKAIKQQSIIDSTFTPVLLITCQTDPYVKIDGLRAGADDYITKPYFCEELQIKVASFLRIKRFADALITDRKDSEEREMKLTLRLYELGL